ncbi:tRNA-specific 2-thiouridylase [Patescibacteria group bacterium]|nr:tRNA-specific 2-thiouridylase [Patescibacteria group bacterium]
MKVAVGLSGGVDSALAAALLKEQGYQVTGVFIECWNEPGCRTDEDRKDALGVALKLKIPFKVLDFKREYRQKVLDWFYREYRAGRTPNPDIVCNQEIKFGLFLEWCLANKFDYVATGHYCRLKVVNHSLAATDNSAAPAAADYLYTRPGKSRLTSGYQSCRGLRKLAAKKVNSFHLFQSVDKDKDQTYFLAMLKEKQLRRVLFPVGHLTKKQVRLEAKERGLAVWNKKDSSGICFIGHDLNFRKFLKRKIKEHEGETVDKKGKVIGKHQGFEFYTIGQRYAKPLFVIEKDIKNNRLIVGSKKDLEKKEFAVERWSRIRGIKPVKEFRSFEGIHPQVMGKSQNTLKVRIRHQGRLIPCKIVGKKVFLKQGEYGIAPGQVAAIYSGIECLGGGVIA